MLRSICAGAIGLLLAGSLAPAEAEGSRLYPRAVKPEDWCAGHLRVDVRNHRNHSRPGLLGFDLQVLIRGDAVGGVRDRQPNQFFE